MHKSWVEEAWRLVFLLALACAVGALSGYFWQMIALALTAYALRNLFNLQRFLRWLSNGAEGDIPIHFGIWGDLYASAQRVRKSHLKREQQLSQLLAQFQASASALPDAAVTLGPQGEIRWFNEAARQLIGLRAPQDLGHPLVNLFRSPDLVNYLASRNFERSIEVPAPSNLQRKLAIRAANYGQGQLLLLAQDVTERYKSEQIRKDFVANVSHELRTPLTVISGFVENMQIDEDALPQHLRKPVELIADQTDRMRHIVEDLLLLARLESGSGESSREPVNVAELSEAIANDARALAGERLQIVVDVRSDMRLAGDLQQLRSAFTNLVVNAVNHTPGTGTITLSWFEQGDSSLFQVCDDGEGIAAEHLARLTERFYRVDVGRSRERGGTGLGLAIVKHILQKHGASLEIESTVGEGSCFSCRFPPARRIAAGT